jgi:hypothetical protein
MSLLSSAQCANCIGSQFTIHMSPPRRDAGCHELAWLAAAGSQAVAHPRRLEDLRDQVLVSSLQPPVDKAFRSTAFPVDGMRNDPLDVLQFGPCGGYPVRHTCSAGRRIIDELQDILQAPGMVSR